MRKLVLAWRLEGDEPDAARRIPAAAMGLVMTVAALLAGCGASLNDEFVTQADTKTGPGLSSGLVSEGSAPKVQLPREAEVLAAVSTPGNAAYKMGPQDVIDIVVYKVPDLSRQAQISDTGTVNLPLVGTIPAAGLTAQQLEKDLVKRYGSKYLQSPQITVVVREYNSQRVTIEGAVKKPGVYPLRTKTTLLQFMAQVGGVDSAVSDNTIVVFRTVNGKRSVAKFDIEELRAGTTKDPVMVEGDVIIANTSQIKSALNNVLKVLPLTGMFLPLI